MFRVTSLTRLEEGELNRWIKRLALILVLGAIAFTGFYLYDRWRPATTPIVDQKVAALEEAVRKDPNDVSSRGQLADSYAAKGRFADAVTQYTAIITSGKEIERATYGRGGAYLALAQYDLASKDFQAVVDIAKGGEMANVDPMLEASYYSLGSIAMKQSKPAEAIPFLESALAIKRSDADALFLIGQAYSATGANDKAEISLRAAVAFVPIGWADPYAALADMFTKAGKTAMASWATAMADVASGKSEAAIPRLKTLVDGDAAVDAMIGLGLAFETKGDTATAAEWYAKAVAKSPDNAAAHLGLSRVSPVAGASTMPSLPVPGAK